MSPDRTGNAPMNMHAWPLIIPNFMYMLLYNLHLKCGNGVMPVLSHSVL